IAARGIGQRHDSRGMQVAVWRQMLFDDLETAAGKTMPQLRPIKTENVGQKSALLGAKNRRCIVHVATRLSKLAVIAGPAAPDPNLPGRAAKYWRHFLRSANSAR